MEIPYHDIEIFKQAFTHTSYANENKLKNHDYERLEFLGDAVLQYHVSRYLFDLYTTMPEGRLTNSVLLKVPPMFFPRTCKSPPYNPRKSISVLCFC